MKLQQFKEEINKINFSQDALNVMNDILDKAIEKKEITDDQKNEISEIIRLEMDSSNVLADALKEFSQSIKEYDDELGKIAEDAEKNMKEIEDDFSSDVNGVINDVQLAQTRDKLENL
ncbi:MAG: hypothetical protein KAQ64_00900 [Candidatus Pacebacteria bacterium]|nr:hypothetical protein [Candidatus Paceibacterota bacterium]